MRREVAFLLFVFGASASVYAQIGALGVMGDSLSDEYFEESYGVYATNWVQQLVNYRSVNVGPTAAQAGQPGGTWGTPRDTGYEFNWALSGDTSTNLLEDGQDTGLAAQVSPDGITHAVLAIGANDFNPDFLTYPTAAYLKIYDGSWSSSQISNYVAQTLSNIETALVTVETTGVKMVVFNILDYGKTPAVYNEFLYTNGSKRERVSAAIEQANAGLVYLAQKYQVPLVDAFGLQQVIFGPNTNLQQHLYIGNVAINLQQSDSDPTNHPNRTAAFVADGAHPHTTIQGLFANMALEALWLGYETDVPLFSEQEILNHAGLAYGGSDTLMAQIGSYTNYVILPIRPRVTSIGFVGANLQLAFTTVSRQFYRVDMTDDLTAPNWTPLTNNVPGTGGAVVIVDTTASAQSQRFYRVRQLP
ncbi:MAG TPA: SGNH/GDSL hydrolase family protein [Verrucomicrobiae bacterium]|nr:SGNH/GDSL hydrolase family protein [Verrucomicrobiae bacterium]